MAKIELNIIKSFIENKDGTFIKEEKRNKSRHITLKCNKDGNIWTAQLSALYNKGQWCKECYRYSKIKKVSVKKVDQVIKEKGFILIGTNKIDYWSDIRLKCPIHNIEWKTKFRHLESGQSNCKLCGHGTVSFDKLNKVITENNAIFIKRLSTKCTVRNILLKCTIHNHEWKTNARDIMVVDRWCYYCAFEKRKTPYKKIKKLVESKGGKLLTKNITGSLTKIEVMCDQEHTWETYYDNLNSKGAWCPICCSVKQKKLFEIIKELYPSLNYKYNYRGFKWLVYKNRMEIDIFVYNDNKTFTLGIEYDGKQHFETVKFASNMSDETQKRVLSEIKKRDTRKNNLIKQHTKDIKYFIRFSYKDIINKDNVVAKLKIYNIPEWSNIDAI